MHGVGRIKMFWMKIKILTKSRSSFSIVSIAAINPANFLLRNVASSRSVPCQKQSNRNVCQHLSQIIQEWTKQNLWKRAFKKFDGVYGLSKEDHISSNFLKAVFHKFYLVHPWTLCPIYYCFQLNDQLGWYYWSQLKRLIVLKFC